MRPIPKNLLNEILLDPYYKKCAREGLYGHTCGGRITLEHAIIFKGRQLNKKWSILPICAKGHSVDEYQDGGDLNKEIHEWIALSRATNKDLQYISKAINYKQRLDYLKGKYGTYKTTNTTESKLQ